MKNYSRQREAILNVLKSTKTHPTANEVYKMVQKEIPNISLGTVYRNLDALNASGNILSISVGSGTTHFDGDNSNHIYLHCKNCQKITDLRFDSKELNFLLENEKFMPESLVCVVDGICSDCSNVSNQKTN